MKHTVQIKLPKIFGKKKEEGPDITTEIHLEDSIVELVELGKKATPYVVVLSFGYLIGSNRTMKKALKTRGA